MLPEFDAGAIFGYASAVVANMLPVAYAAAGISLGFVVLFRVIEAFRR